tara:strand:- start:418 stop:732 length:315 start_codon:yes stop_codon:yes gene_type:complete
MMKKQIKEFAFYLINKTGGSFHIEKDNWKSFFTEKQVKQNDKKLSKIINGKHYEYFCNCIFKAFEKLSAEDCNETNMEKMLTNEYFRILRKQHDELMSRVWKNC